MKYKKNLSICLIFLCTLAFNHTMQAILSVSQYKPDSFIQKPYFVQDDFTNISSSFSGGFASQAFNKNGKKVPYLQQFGSEDFLKRFTDSSLAHDDTQSFGQGQLTGEFHVREIILSCYKNMTSGFFIEAATVIQDLVMSSISADFIHVPIPLTQQQIEYVEALQQKIPTSINSSGMFTTACYAGYSKTYSEFTHLDFVDFTIKTGFTSPQAMSNNNTSIVQFPFHGNMNFGYPVIAAASIGVLDWITVGCNGSITPWQPVTKTIPLNTSLSGNNLLISQSGVARIARKPLFTTAIYFEADHVYQGISGTVAYLYTKNGDYSITALDQIQFSNDIVNQSALFDAWSFGSLYLQFDVDFACQSTPSAPVITFFCNIPVVGQLCPKTNIFGGACSLQVSYNF